ncbi:hypothetical protein [Oryzomonas rubra]|uniref:Pectate lyase superfamily protein n=1 Tax=Oryzomonas rubra TaxID=2509454 RepID=A0A5A9XLW7_9BACT|nr:hypothetical protein [Oryzomonas rubra]KAA0894152.1 hypothetical protein ET418_04125 [Oryzomonas rubra]
MGTGIPQTAFTAGELAPSLYGRVDLARYLTGLKTCRNFMMLQQVGSIFKRAIRVPVENDTNQVIAVAGTLANKVVGWNAEGTLTDLPLSINTMQFSLSAPWVDARAYGSLTECLAQVGGLSADILISSVVALTANTAVQRNVRLVFVGGGSVDLGAYNLSVLAPIQASNNHKLFLKSGAGSVAFATGSNGCSPGWFGAIGDGVTDDSDAIQACINASNGGRILFPCGIFRYTKKITAPSSPIRGSWIFQGQGSTFYWDTNGPMGTALMWDGDDDSIDTIELGAIGKPLAIDGVSQTANWPWGQFNYQFKDMAVLLKKGCKSFLYAHDQDGVQIENVYVDGQGNKLIRGVFDFRGSSNNMRMQQLTMANIPCGYGIRVGDGASNWGAYQPIVQNVALAYWIGDTKVYEDSYQNGNITIEDSTFEGVSGDGQFLVSTLVASTSNSDISVNVANGSLFTVDDPVYIGRGDNNFEMNRVTLVNNNVLTLAYPLEYDHLYGDPIKAGRIGVHIGRSSTRMGRAQAIEIRRPMFDRYGCCIEAHDVEGLKIVLPTFVSRIQRGFYFDGECQNITLEVPHVLGNQLSTWRLFEITNRGGVYNIIWLGGADKSGVVQPYINNQGEIASWYIGDFTQTNGNSEFPSYFRGLSFNAVEGIVLRETDGALGVKYKTGSGTGNVNFQVTPGGEVHCLHSMSKYGMVVSTPDGTKQYRIWVNDQGAVTSTLIT